MTNNCQYHRQSVHTENIYQWDQRKNIKSQIKNISRILKYLVVRYTCKFINQIIYTLLLSVTGLAVILVLMSVSTLITAVILYVWQQIQEIS
jgi:hypothetical protein